MDQSNPNIFACKHELTLDINPCAMAEIEKFIYVVGCYEKSKDSEQVVGSIKLISSEDGSLKVIHE